MKCFRIAFATAVICMFVCLENSSACSTFLLSSNNCQIVGHNLDENHRVPGYLIINQRGLEKTNISWNELLKGEKAQNKRISWISKYGSVTFNPGGGKEFPDGGMNEKGLVICEMSLGETRYPKDGTRPKMFMMQWIQYQLDNYSSVVEVLAHLDKFELDGWGWHFFVADKLGNKAIIEFLDKSVRVYKEDEMPYPVLCNTKYEDELNYINSFASYGGSNNVDLANKEDKNRFVHANYMIDRFQANDPISSIDYGFDILQQLNSQGITKWSIVYDIKNLKVYFHTAEATKKKELDFKDVDFSCQSATVVYDLDNQNGAGDIAAWVQKYDAKDMKKTLKTMWKSSLKNESFLTRALVKKWATKGMLSYNEKLYCRYEEQTENLENL